MRVLFWGTPEFSLPALRALSGEGHDVVGVVTQPDRPAGRGRAVASSPVKQAAMAEGIPVLQPEKAGAPDFLTQLRSLEPEVSVVVAYGQILPQRVLDLPEFGSINIHASLLPELRGAAPIHWAIIRGLEASGVSIMKMEKGLDSGPVLYRVPEPIRADETMRDLSLRLSELGAEALIESLTLLEMDGIVLEPQDHERATYAPKLDRETARLDWTLPAIEIARWVRGLDSVPGAWSLHRGAPLKVFAPRVEIQESEPGLVIEVDEEAGVLVGAGEHAVRLRELQPSGKRRMSAGELVRGRGIAAGDLLG